MVRCKNIAMLKDQAKPPKAVLFFDGDCPLCNRVLTFLLSNEIRADLVFSPLNASSSDRWREERVVSINTASRDWPSSNGCR